MKNFLEFSDGLGFEHKILASYTLEDFATVSESFRGDRPIFYNVATGRYFSAFDPAEALNPDFFQATSSVGFALKNRGSRLNQKFEEQGINVLDYITLNERFAVLIGGRHSEFANTLAACAEVLFIPRGTSSHSMRHTPKGTCHRAVCWISMIGRSMRKQRSPMKRVSSWLCATRGC